MAKPPRVQTRTVERLAQPVSIPVSAERGRTSRGSDQAARSAAYPEAVALYQQALQLLQRHDYQAAADALRSVLSLYPEEKELLERVRLYLNVCERHASPPPRMTPQTREERLFAATVAMNAERLDEAMALLQAVLAEDSDHDGALYMLAVVHAQRREHVEALEFLRRAVALNRDNRALALHEPDLEELLQDPSARALLQSAVAAPPEPVRSSTARTRAGR